MIIRRGAAIALGLLACGGAIAPARAAEGGGAVTAAGSTALLPLVKTAAERYARVRPDVRVSVSGGGSGAGITQVSIGAIDIGDSDIPAPGTPGILDHKVAVVGFAIIAHPGVPVADLTLRATREIFSGQRANWNEFGGPDLPIVVVNRPRSSGTRKVFARVVMGAQPIADSSLTVDASGTVVSTVATTPGAISYVALSAVRDASVRRLTLDGARASASEIASGRYPLWAYEHMFTSDRPASAARDFIAWITRNRALLEELGYIPVAAMRVRRGDR